VVDDFPRPHPVQVEGNSLARTLFEALGWRIAFDGLPARQGVLIVYPHTSNWDFFVLILAKWVVGLPLKFWVKESLFALPVLGRWLRGLGGVPVARGSPQGIVGGMVRTLDQCRASDVFFWLALTPEGTRQRTAGWRSGFYQVALGAGVPLGTCCVNFREKTVVVSRFYQLSGDVQADMARIVQAFHGAVGRHAAQASPIHMIEK
jgi:1-acyl-sn-glycerol-3-phosphate acyltransferase